MKLHYVTEVENAWQKSQHGKNKTLENKIGVGGRIQQKSQRRKYLEVGWLQMFLKAERRWPNLEGNIIKERTS